MNTSCWYGTIWECTVSQISDPWFVILPPANTLEAQLIKRGPAPGIITEGVELHYQVEPGHENPADHVRFWDYAEVMSV
jgi:hypothetical protein